MKVGPYRILRRIAAGGMAEVFLARRAGPGGFAKDVAVKRVLPHLVDLPAFTSMFFEEARLLGRCAHPGVVQAFEVGHDAGGAWMAMEYVHGADLVTVCRRAREQAKDLPPALAAAIVAAAADALDHVHELRGDDGAPLAIVHRDVTPANLLVSYDGAVKLADLGVAVAGAAADPRLVKGTRWYMAPEQRAGEVVDRRADVYALGIVLWELLAGRRLRREDDDLSVPPLPDAVPPALDAVCRRALAPRREDRHGSAAELLAALEETGLVTGGARAREALRGFLREVFGPDAAERARAAFAAAGAAAEEPTVPMPIAIRRRAPAAPPPQRRSAVPWIIVAAAIALWLGAALRGHGPEPESGAGDAPRAEIRLALPGQK